MNKYGQASIEYILVFAFLGFIGFTLMKGLTNFSDNLIGTLGYNLTQELTTGVCGRNCFIDSYANRGR